MPQTLRITRSFNHFGRIPQEVIEELDQVVRDAATEVQYRAQMDAPVDTGALRESLHVVTDIYSNYADSAAKAAELRHAGNRPDSPAVILPEEKPTKPHYALVASCVAHAYPNEYGGVTMPPRPFLTPAVANTADHFFQDVEDVLNRRKRQDNDNNDADPTDAGAAETALPALGEAEAALPAIEAAAPLLLL